MITTAALNRAFGWSGDPIWVVYRAEQVVIGPANHVFAWVVFAKEHCSAMVLRVSSAVTQHGFRKCGRLGEWFSEPPNNELSLHRQASNKQITMPIVITFDIQGAPPVERNRIQSFFERFGWENLGGSSYRYPRLGTDDQPVEDWFNHVIPALMLFRTYLVSSGRTLIKCTLDVQSSSGYSPNANYGKPPLDGAAAPLYPPTNPAFGEQNLRSWLTDMPYPY